MFSQIFLSNGIYQNICVYWANHFTISKAFYFLSKESSLNKQVITTLQIFQSASNAMHRLNRLGFDDSKYSIYSKQRPKISYAFAMAEMDLFPPELV
ncbi:hypothetical protein CDAR_26611 [Caerostris darwini]|uniref:Uncharacterized protein n=1 Tax=Caerostris darwini TaxID=1538125 RepID=A0AAV4QFV8_9ARAC|nr:hypothetical protein CDAR_26611 [Caerostris darwini]